MTTWPQILRTLIAGTDLSAEQATWAMSSILEGGATEAQIGGFAMALRAKGETPVEVEAFVAVMLQRARRVEHDFIALDVVGTGGDSSHSVNISTMSALVAAAAGAPVVKHGNRAASSSTGTADVLEELGVNIGLEPEQVATCARDAGIAFCFAPLHHPAMKYAAQARRDLGVPTLFNILGPLANPALAEAALVGCADAERAAVMADVLHRRGVKALVVRGDDGLDEISTVTTTTIWDATKTAIAKVTLDPRDLGVAPVDQALLVGGDKVRNAELLRKALGGATIRDADEARVSAIRDVVAINAAAALVAYDAAMGGSTAGSLTERIAGQLARARAVIDSGAALRLLETWVEVCRRITA
jgi:anthranilate phosphoribosyltransferase